MPRALAVTFRIIDWSMLAYWSVALLACLGMLKLPASSMYAGYGTALIDAWNWSFAPIDVAFAATGLGSVVLARRGDARWMGLAIISATLTFCAGAMAIAFWAIAGEFDLAWWLPNLLLSAVGLYWAGRLTQRN